MKILGMMSGTSFDGIDSAMCDFNIVDNEIQIKLLHFESQNYKEDVRDRIVAAMPPLNTSMLDAGVYMIELTVNNQTMVQRLIIE